MYAEIIKKLEAAEDFAVKLIPQIPASKKVQRGRIRRARRCLVRARIALTGSNRDRAEVNISRAENFARRAEETGVAKAGKLVNRIVVIDEALSLVPSWTFEERAAIQMDFLRTGRTGTETQEGKYALTMAYAALPNAKRKALRDAHKEMGYTHYPISIKGEANRWWNAPTFDFSNRPEDFAAALQELVLDGFIPVVELFTQDQIGDFTLDQVSTYAKKHQKAWGHLCGVVWLALEHNEAVHPKSQKEGLRGDDWIVAAGGRVERIFKDAPVMFHQTSGEFHYYTKWADGGKAGEAPPEYALCGFQFHSWSPDPNEMVEYEPGVMMRSLDAHFKDLRYVTQRSRAECGDKQIVLVCEYCQLNTHWKDEDVFAMGSRLAEECSKLNGYYNFGNGAS